MHCPQSDKNIEENIPQFLISISSDTVICYSISENPATLYLAITEISDDTKVPIRRAYPLWVFDLEEFKKNPNVYYKKYENPSYNDQTVEVAGIYIIPKMGDIAVTGTTLTTQHALIITGNIGAEYLYQYGLGCRGNGCGTEMLNLFRENIILICYNGPYQDKVRNEVIKIGNEIAKLSSYSVLQVCTTLLPYGCRSTNKTLKNIIKYYEQHLNENKPMNQICSSFVIIVYLLVLNNVFQSHNKEPNFEEIFGLHPEHCFPKDIIQWAKSNPKYWLMFEIPEQLANVHSNGDEKTITSGYLHFWEDKMKWLKK